MWQNAYAKMLTYVNIAYYKCAFMRISLLGDGVSDVLLFKIMELL
jgi:hypothetical protein